MQTGILLIRTEVLVKKAVPEWRIPAFAGLPSCSDLELSMRKRSGKGSAGCPGPGNLHCPGAEVNIVEAFDKVIFDKATFDKVIGKNLQIFLTYFF